MTDVTCYICRRKPDETPFRPYDLNKSGWRSYCNDCKRNDEWRRRNPKGTKCVICHVLKSRDDYEVRNNRIARRCKKCDAAKANIATHLTCIICNITKPNRAFRNDKLQANGKDDHCRACRGVGHVKPPKPSADLPSNCGGFVDDASADSFDDFGRVSRIDTAELSGLGASGAAQTMDDRGGQS
jgi:hypothetical protein